LNATALVDDLTRRGVMLSAIGDRLRVNAPRGVVTPDIRAALTEHKRALLLLLAGQRPGSRWRESETGYLAPDDLPESWREWFEERAAIREYDGGQTREHAEAEALRETMNAMQAAGDHRARAVE